MTMKIPSSFIQLHKTIYKQAKFSVKQPISTCSLNNVMLSFVFLKGDCISTLDPCKGAQWLSLDFDHEVSLNRKSRDCLECWPLK